MRLAPLLLALKVELSKPLEAVELDASPPR